jgi:drug/metabolite transporter (DMT)-like permease
MAFGDALVKSVSGELSLWQIYVLRSLLALPLLLLPSMTARRIAPPRPRAVGWVALRCLLLMAMWIVFYAAVARASLATVAACYYTGPLFVLLLSRLLLGEPVPGLRRLGLALGFAGVLVKLRPVGAGFSWLALPAVAAGFLYALAAIITRARCAGESPPLLSLGMMLGFLAVGLAGSAAAWACAPVGGAGSSFLLAPWAPMGPRHWALMAVRAGW